MKRSFTERSKFNGAWRAASIAIRNHWMGGLINVGSKGPQNSAIIFFRSRRSVGETVRSGKRREKERRKRRCIPSSEPDCAITSRVASSHSDCRFEYMNGGPAGRNWEAEVNAKGLVQDQWGKTNFWGPDTCESLRWKKIMS